MGEPNNSKLLDVTLPVDEDVGEEDFNIDDTIFNDIVTEEDRLLLILKIRYWE